MSSVDESRAQLETLINLLGRDVFFVPCHWGTKQPLITYKERPFEGTKTPAYLMIFSEVKTNIAVYLGKASNGLCAIDFDHDEDLISFLKLNPKLAGTTRSRGNRGAMIWVRVDGSYPESCNPAQKRFEWRADNCISLIYGLHPAGVNYTIIVNNPPVTIRFEEIVWPAGWDLPWETAASKELEKHHGQPFYLTTKGALTSVNEAYWAALHAVENVLLFEPTEGDFFTYNHINGLYEIESVDSIKTKISNRMLEASRQMKVFGLERFRTAKTLNSIVAHLRGLVEVRDAFKNRGTHIHLANGVLVLEGDDATLRSFSPEFRSRNGSPIVFDPTATCARFLSELLLPAVHPDDVEILQKFAGMCLLGDNRAQRMLILDGEAGRGKTQFAVVVQGLVGMLNVTQLRTAFLGEKFETFRYLKKTLLVGVDVEPDFLSTQGAGHLKGIVGGDWFDAEQKGGTGSFQFQGKFNVLITSNTRLRVRLEGDVGAWRRRLIIVRFELPAPTKKIPDFGSSLLKSEGSGILNWALLGAKKLLKEIPQGGGDFILTPHQCGIVDSLLAESDSLRCFLAERLVKGEPGDLTTNELIEAYSAYCPEKRWQPLPITEIQSKLEGLMLDLFGVTKRHDIKRNGKSQRGYAGVKLKG